MRREFGPGANSPGEGRAVEQEMHPELLLADRLVQSLSVPVPIDELLATVADVADVAMPTDLDVDAVTITAPQLNRPKVLVNVSKTMTANRRRFTLAHELAHVVIPWHVGTIGCSTAVDTPLANNWAAEREAEANRFAARVLVPQKWLLDDVVPNDADAMLETLSRAQVSTLPALIRLTSELPLGWMIATTPPDPPLLLRSPGSAISPRIGSHTGPLAVVGDARGVSRLSARAVRWWQWTLRVPPFPDLPEIGPRARRSTVEIRRDQLRDRATEILRAILSDIELADTQLANFAGLTGLVADRAPLRSPAGMFSVLRQRFADPTIPHALTAHALFEDYLAAKAWQFADVPGLY